MPWLICGTFPSEKPYLLAGRADFKLGAARALRSDEELAEQHPNVLPDSLIIIPSAELPAVKNSADLTFAAKAVAETVAKTATGAAAEDVAGAGAFAVAATIATNATAQINTLPIGRGTSALAAAAAITCKETGIEAPYVLIAGDNGNGAGSKLVYEYLCANAACFSGWGITFHYLLPDVDWHNRVLMALEDVPQKPFLCADAGFMYAAKMSGYAENYDLFTPDIGELAFLADENAPHPFYTRGFLLADEAEAPSLIKRAVEHNNSAKNMLVKGRVDMLVQHGEIIRKVDYPMVPNLEPIGGTGDTVAGIASGFLSAGYPVLKACTLAAMANRFMGQLAQPTPATQISELLGQLAGGIRLALQELE